MNNTLAIHSMYDNYKVCENPTLNNLPKGILEEILIFLPVQDLMKAKELNSYFYNTIENFSGRIKRESHCLPLSMTLSKRYLGRASIGFEKTILRQLRNAPISQQKKMNFVNKVVDRTTEVSAHIFAEMSLKELLEVYKFSTSPVGIRYLQQAKKVEEAVLLIFSNIPSIYKEWLS